MAVLKGKGFIVIEGLDGSGKSTQIKLLLDYLKRHGQPCRYLHFPRTDSSLYGDLIARYLRGDLGPVESVNPYLVALIFAGDRYAAKEVMENWISRKYTVVTDRYVNSNIAFQCAKMPGEKEKQALKQWILKLEYGHHAIPRPDMNIFLDVPFGFTKKNLAVSRRGKDRLYLRGKQDIHEQDLELQKKVKEVYLEFAGEDPTVKVLDCSDGKGEMLPPQRIFDKVRELLFPGIVKR